LNHYVLKQSTLPNDLFRHVIAILVAIENNLFKLTATQNIETRPYSKSAGLPFGKTIAKGVHG
jgi:hypothetical protein